MKQTTEFPKEAVKFKTWADEACRDWPVELTALADAAWRSLEGRNGYPESCIADFSTAYESYIAQLR